MNVKINSTGGLSVGDATNGYKDLATKEYVDNKTFTVSWNDVSGKPTTFTPTSHNHSAADINSGTLDIARIPTGTSSTTVSLGNHTHSDYVATTGHQSVSGIKKFNTIYVGTNPLSSVSADISINPGFTTTIEGSNCWAQFSDNSNGYLYVYSDDCGQLYYKPATGAEVTLNLPKTNGTLATQQWVSGEHLSKNTTNTQTVLSQINLSGSINVSRSHEITVGDFNAGTFASLYSDDTDAYVYAGLDAGTRYSFLTSNGLHHTEDGETTTTDLSFPAPSGSGTIATNTQVNAAIGTINGNFTNLNNFIGSWVETAQVSVGSIASGWSFSPDGSTWNNKLKFFHWGRMAYIFGHARKSSAIAINTNSGNIGTIAWPSGYTMMSAGGNVGDQRINLSITSNGGISVVNVIAFSANAAMSIRAFMPASVTLNLATVATI